MLIICVSLTHWAASSLLIAETVIFLPAEVDSADQSVFNIVGGTSTVISSPVAEYGERRSPHLALKMVISSASCFVCLSH